MREVEVVDVRVDVEGIDDVTRGLESDTTVRYVKCSQTWAFTYEIMDLSTRCLAKLAASNVHRS